MRDRAETSTAPRLCLDSTDSPDALLDGGWWPRSYDPVAELRELVLAIDDRHLPIARILLGMSDWGSRQPRLLSIAGTAATRMIRLRWFADMPAGLLIAFCSDGERVDLLTVPPYTDTSTAWAAMELAAQPDNDLHTPDILRAITQSAPAAQTATAAVPARTWENEAGHLTEPE